MDYYALNLDLEGKEEREESKGGEDARLVDLEGKPIPSVRS